jgi:hypothetical protein
MFKLKACPTTMPATGSEMPKNMSESQCFKIKALDKGETIRGFKFKADKTYRNPKQARLRRIG